MMRILLHGTDRQFARNAQGAFVNGLTMPSGLMIPNSARSRWVFIGDYAVDKGVDVDTGTDKNGTTDELRCIREDRERDCRE